MTRATRWRLVGLLGALGALSVLGVACSGAEADELTTEEFCTELESVQPLIDSFGQLETTQIPDQRAALDEIASQAPADISEPFGVLVAYIDAAADALGPVRSGDVDGAREALRPLGEQVADAQAAGQAVEAWSVATCGLELRTGDTVTPPPPPPTEGPGGGPPETVVLPSG